MVGSGATAPAPAYSLAGLDRCPHAGGLVAECRRPSQAPQPTPDLRTAHAAAPTTRSRHSPERRQCIQSPAHQTVVLRLRTLLCPHTPPSSPPPKPSTHTLFLVALPTENRRRQRSTTVDVGGGGCPFSPRSNRAAHAFVTAAMNSTSSQSSSLSLSSQRTGIRSWEGSSKTAQLHKRPSSISDPLLSPASAIAPDGKRFAEGMVNGSAHSQRPSATETSPRSKMPTGGSLALVRPRGSRDAEPRASKRQSMGTVNLASALSASSEGNAFSTIFSDVAATATTAHELAVRFLNKRGNRKPMTLPASSRVVSHTDTRAVDHPEEPVPQRCSRSKLQQNTATALLQEQHQGDILALSAYPDAREQAALQENLQHLVGRALPSSFPPIRKRLEDETALLLKDAKKMHVVVISGKRPAAPPETSDSLANHSTVMAIPSPQLIATGLCFAEVESGRSGERRETSTSNGGVMVVHAGDSEDHEGQQPLHDVAPPPSGHTPRCPLTPKGEDLYTVHAGHPILLLQSVREQAKRAIHAGDSECALLLPKMVAHAARVITDVEKRWVLEIQKRRNEFPGIHGCTSDRGLAVPFEYYEELLSEVRGTLIHQYNHLSRVYSKLTLLGSAEDTTSPGVLPPVHPPYGELESTHPDCCKKGDHTLFGPQKPNSVANVYPAPGTLPRPLLVVDTAIGVCVLWRMLSQAVESIPSLSTALRILTHTVLPHVYGQFDSLRPILPSMGSLCSQVQQLTELPLRAITLTVACSTALETAEDVQYLKTSLLNWSFRIWRRNIALQRRRDTVVDLLDRTLSRARHRVLKGRVLSAWRMETSRGIVARAQSEAAGRFRRFVETAQHAARSNNLLSTLKENWGENAQAKSENAGSALPERLFIENTASSAIDSSTAEFISRQLAQTAVHVKGQRNGHVTSVAGSTCSPSAATALVELGCRAGRKASTTPHDSAVSPLVTSSSSQWSGSTLYDAILKKLQETEEISGYLRSQIAIQSSMIDKLEKENRHVAERAARLEADLLKCVREKLEQCNLVQEKELRIREQRRQIIRLKARVRANAARPWQRVLMRVVGDVMGVSTRSSEMRDECRIFANYRSRPVGGVPGAASSEGGSSERVSQHHGSKAIDDFMAPNAGDHDEEVLPSPDEVNDVAYMEAMERVSEEERIFGALAPIVLTSTKEMPDSFTILRDWANGCLDFLDSLDQLRGAPPTARFNTLCGAEVANGELISRVLYYLALPRFGPAPGRRVSDPDHVGEEPSLGDSPGHEGVPAAITNMGIPKSRRKQLLNQQGVHLDSPFPTYSDCFSDLASMDSSTCFAVLMDFATELVQGVDHIDGDSSGIMAKMRDLAFNSSETPAPPPVARIELFEVIDPRALALGERWAVVTLLALLYIRFAHPFHHKSSACVARERDAIVFLLSNGKSTLKGLMNFEGSGIGNTSHDAVSRSGTDAVVEDTATSRSVGSNIARELLSYLEDEDKSPWLLFQEYCTPLLTSQAHVHVLRGSFWGASAFESPELGGILGALGMALMRSLELHRWHIMMSCLVPVSTYGGLSRGVFTGQRAPLVALVTELQSSEEWRAPLGSSCITSANQRRWASVVSAVSCGTLAREDAEAAYCADPATSSVAQTERMIHELAAVLGPLQSDLLSMYLNHSEIVVDSSTPILRLCGWRLLWADAGIVERTDEADDEGEEGRLPEDGQLLSSAAAPVISMSEVTRIFYDAASGEEEANLGTASRRGSKRLSNAFAFSLQPHRDTLTFGGFVAGVVLLADALFPPLLDTTHGNPLASTVAGASAQNPIRQVVTLANAVSFLFARHVFTRISPDAPEAALLRITLGSSTQRTLQRRNPQLLLIFQIYSRMFEGTPVMERDDILRLLRDTMLTSTEISQTLISELFGYCCVRRTPLESEMDSRQTNLNRMPWDERRRGDATVSLLIPGSSEHPIPVGKSGHKEPDRMQRFVLTFDGFVQFLCALCYFRQPNPFTPYAQRLEMFLRRSVVTPLARKHESLARLTTQQRFRAKRSTGSSLVSSAQASKN